MRALLLFLALSTSLFAGREKPFVVIVPSYNNEAYVEKNLRSIFSQKYDNYRLLYIDDNSTDATLEKATTLLKELDGAKRTTLIHNTENQGGLANVYNALHTCLGEEIVVLLDGDDFFAHEKVLEKLNTYYCDEDIWITHGGSLEYPSYKKLEKEKPSVSPLRSFYAALAQKVPLDTLYMRGNFYPMRWDLALMLPMIQLAKAHVKELKESLYLSNTENPLADKALNPSFIKECEEHILSRASQAPLKRLHTSLEPSQEKADILVFSDQNPEGLAHTLTYLEASEGKDKVTVLYHSTSSKMESLYLEVKLKFPKVELFPWQENFKKQVCTLLQGKSAFTNSFLLIVSDKEALSRPLDLTKGLRALKATRAYGLYYTLSPQLTYCKALERFQAIPTHSFLPGIPSKAPLYAWQMTGGSGDFNTPANLLCTLYSKERLKKIFKKIEFDSPNTLQEEWNLSAPSQIIGLFQKIPQ